MRWIGLKLTWMDRFRPEKGPRQIFTIFSYARPIFLNISAVNADQSWFNYVDNGCLVSFLWSAGFGRFHKKLNPDFCRPGRIYIVRQTKGKDE
jgi:hypothetical protein